MTSLVPLFDPTTIHANLRSELSAAFHRVLDSGCFIGGSEVTQFETECQRFLGSPHAIGTSSGTDALLSILLGLGIGPGDEVITTPLSFVATAEVVLRVGATVVFADVDGDSCCLSPKAVEQSFSTRTRAVLGVHLFGQPDNAGALRELCREHRVDFIEDACQAFGAKYRNWYAGTLGTAGAFSFFPTKPLGGFGDGGLVVCEDDELARRIRALTVHGASSAQRYQWLGGNLRLDALQAALLRTKLPHVSSWIAERTRRATRYSEALVGLDRIRLPKATERGIEQAWSLYSIRVREGRDSLHAQLRSSGIEARIYYPEVLSEQPIFRGRCRSDGLVEARKATLELLSLPLYSTMNDMAQDLVIDTIRKWHS
jgi:dTDP-4-amino-4,6-dideoxygalactose transaminase